jgi:hypothetical protein
LSAIALPPGGVCLKDAGRGLAREAHLSPKSHDTAVIARDQKPKSHHRGTLEHSGLCHTSIAGVELYKAYRILVGGRGRVALSSRLRGFIERGFRYDKEIQRDQPQNQARNHADDNKRHEFAAKGRNFLRGPHPRKHRLL